jgi:DNA-binding transcriptional regulator YdaS (Cro superfamily)
MNALSDHLAAKRGNLTALARAIGVTPGAIAQWNGRVPAERLGEVSRATGIPVEQLRPEIFAAPAQGDAP